MVSTQSASAAAPLVAQSSNFGAKSPLPGADSGQLIRARYIGGQGRGPHYYRPDNPRRHNYRVQHGVVIMADINDTCSKESFDAGTCRYLLIREEVQPAPQPIQAQSPQSAPPRQAPPPAPRPTAATPPPPPPDAPQEEASPKAGVMTIQDVIALRKKAKQKLTPLRSPEEKSVTELLTDDLDEMPLKAADVIERLRLPVTQDMVASWLEQEKAGKNRKTVLAALEKKLG